ncbi:MAG: hypothetical protein WCY86_08935 [Spirosomataceae bacterium]
MKAIKIIVLLMVLGLSQAWATGFAHNMNKAQQMLKGKKEVVNNRDTSTNKVKIESEKSEAKKVFSFEKEASDTDHDRGSLSDQVVGTLIQWISQAMIKFVTFGR